MSADNDKCVLVVGGGIGWWTFKRYGFAQPFATFMLVNGDRIDPASVETISIEEESEGTWAN